MQIIYDEFLESLNADDVLQLLDKQFPGKLFSVSRIKHTLEYSFQQPQDRKSVV